MSKLKVKRPIIFNCEYQKNDWTLIIQHKYLKIKIKELKYVWLIGSRLQSNVVNM